MTFISKLEEVRTEQLNHLSEGLDRKGYEMRKYQQF